METNKIYQGDCLELMKELEDNSIDLVVTSPPYDNLREYKGYTFNFEGIAKELFRIMKNGGIVVWVVNDATINGSETGTSFRQALYFKQVGFNLHDTMIYHKTGLTYPEVNRYYPSFEYMFILSKGKPKTYNLIKDNKNKNFGKRTNVVNRLSNGSTHFKKDIIIKEFSIRQNVWSFDVRKNDIKNKINHPAMFPEKLAEDHILSWSNQGDLVLDIMCGSGTTCKMALKNNRKFLGFEISEEYCKIANERLTKLNDGNDGIPPKPKDLGILPTII